MMIYTNKVTIGKETVANRTPKLLHTVGVSLLAAALMSGCIKDELYNTPHPHKGAMRVATDWTAISEDATRPQTYLLRIGQLTHEVSGADNTFEHLLSPESHTLWVHNTPAGITIDGTKAEVNTLPDGTLEPLPDYLFSATKQLDVIKDDTLKVTLKMAQSLRTLQLVLKLNAEDAERIASTTATLTNIAHTIDLATGQADVAGAGKTVAPNFRTGSINPTRASAHPALITRLRLAGMASGSRQLLTLRITLSDGTVIPIETDLTEALNNFDKEMKPLALDAAITLPGNPAEMGATATITDWEVVDNGNITIH